MIFRGKLWASLLQLTTAAIGFSAAAQETIYIHTDALGSVVAESNADGVVTTQFTYEPYGAVVGDPVVDGPGYASHVRDAATGLSYMQQRYMDPQLGVFLSVDPVAAHEQPLGQFNRYHYANGNPYKFTDPDGRNAVLAEWLIPIGIAVTVTYVAMPSEQKAEIGDFAQKALGEAVKSIEGLFQKNEASSEASSSGSTGNGERNLEDLEPIHAPDHPQNDPKIGKLSDKELANAINNPANGDKVTVRGNKVLDGNTRINEARGRGWPGSTKIPVTELPAPPQNLDEDPLGPYGDF